MRVSLSSVLLLLVASGLFLMIPMYRLVWWWDVVVHVFWTLAVVQIMRELGLSWEQSLFVLAGGSVLFELMEYHVWFFINGYMDALKDIGVNIATWGTMRVLSVTNLSVPPVLPESSEQTE